jgi:hypothetical protein
MNVLYAPATRAMLPRRIGASAARFLISPHELLKVKYFVEFCSALVVVEEILLVYSISLSMIQRRCLKDESRNVLKAPYTLLVLLVSFQLAYYFLHLMSTIFLRFKDQNLAYQNRTRLALCTRGLSEAQKKRIRRTNFSMDIVMCCWTIYILLNYTLYSIFDAAQCSYMGQDGDSSRSTSCVACESLNMMFFFCILAGMIVNFLSKLSLVSSEIDFTAQSQQIEAILAYSTSESSMVRWYRNAEARYATAVPYICCAFFALVVVFFCWYFSDHQLPAGFTWNVNVLSRSTWAVLAVCFLLSCTDGSILRMIGRMLRLLVQNRSAQRQGATRGIFSWRGLTSLPRRKFVFALLSWTVMPLLAGYISASVGALGEIYYYSIGALIFNTLFFVVPMFVVHDRRMSINDLLDLSSGDDNYGLVLSRQHFVKELRNALKTFIATTLERGTEPIEINIPSFLASQARVELSVAVSYRWTDENLYKKKGNHRSTLERDSELSESEAPRVIYLSNHSCSGFDWNVKLTMPQVKMLLDGLSDAPEDYVWMDQFCIPQKNNTGIVVEIVDEQNKDFMEHEMKKGSVRGKLVSRMTGLYACAGRVLVINNSGDDKLVEADWYQNRLWCVQEYGFAWNLTVSSLSNEYTNRILDRRGLFQKRWFDSSRKVDHADESSEIILDWMHISDKEILKKMIIARVRSIDCAPYIKLLTELSASDSNDTFSALAQPWFGIVMTSEESRKMLAQAITAKSISEPGVEEFNVITNMNADKQFARCRGSMRIERMLSCYLGGLESGETSVHVRRFLFAIEASYKFSDICLCNLGLTGYYAML